MHKIVAKCLIIYCVLVCFILVKHVNDLNKPKKCLNYMGFIPFSRFGRREAAEIIAKLRNDLLEFPRIGKSQSMTQDMRGNSSKTMNIGLCFGPLLERVQKRNPCEGFEKCYNSMAPGKKRTVFYPPHLAQKSKKKLD